MMKRYIWLTVLGIFLLLQLFSPSTTNPPVNQAVDFQTVANPSPELLATLKAACYDCHSNETKWPWYSKIAPVSFWVNQHVKEGREKLNFSEFGNPAGVGRELHEVSEVVEEGEMPLKSYTQFGMHPEAKLSSDQKNILIQYFSQYRKEKGAGKKQEG